MLFIWDLGFSSLVLVLSLLLPLIGFFVRRKWQLSVARQAEIKRLLILASEEAARVELEATIEYGAVSISWNYHQCAVCYCPTTTRCARCKGVRYCSAKCQIIHWRQGHKEECHPPAIAIHQSHDEGSDYGQKAINQDQYGDRYEIEEKSHAKLIGTSSTESALFSSITGPALLSSSSSSVVLDGKDNDAKVEFHADREGLSSAPESSSASFSGFSSAAGSESSDDVSVCESVSSNELDKLDGSSSADVNLDTIWTSVVNNVDQTNPSSPKFVRLVDSVDEISKLSHSKPDQSEESQCRATSSSGLGVSDMSEGSNAEASRFSSDFWGRTLESVPSTSVDDNESFNSYHKEGGKRALLDSGSSLHFSFTLAGNASSSYPQVSKVKDAKLDDATQCATTLGHSKLSDGVVLSENAGLDSPNEGNSKSSNSECTNQGECGSNNIQHVINPREAINIDVPLVGSLSSSHFEKSGSTVVTNGPSISNASHLSESSDSYSSSDRVHAVPNVKSGKFDDVHANFTKLSQFSSYSSNGKNGLKTSMWKVVDQFRVSKFPKHHPFGVSNEGIFPYESFVKLYSWNKVELQPRGLVNCGNSCYANAVLQCLTFTPPLTAYFLHGIHSKACAKKDWCFTCEFEKLILKAKDGKSPLSPIGILSQLQNIGSQLANGKEEDAHEFLRYAIDAMQSICLKEAGLASSGCLEEETTLIGLTFGGYLRSKIKCMKCQGKSERHEKMMDLTVEIEGNIGTLEEALRRFTRTEILDGENKYQCSRCKSYEKAKKKLTILEAPNILTIALKRFQSGKFGKLNKAIRFPEILNLAPYMSGTSDKSPIYRLYGVVVHLDIMNAAFSGHYLCYVKNAQNKWFKIDDSMVTSTELERVLTKGAYMLLYARCSPRAPRLMKNRSKAIPSSVNSKNPLKSNSLTYSGLDEFHPSLIHSDTPSSIESFYSKYNQLQRILEDSSSSDSCSLFSVNSDEGSCSTDSRRDSTSTDDLIDSIFGDSVQGWNSPWRSCDSDASSSSSSSPLYLRHSPVADLDRYSSGSPKIRSSRMDEEGKRDDPFFHSDTMSKQCRKVVVA
ncbi:hypothetical protein Goshw_009800 [Gossypium schwendimanii]|uniref:ubiquitinyl hydrolase 1 n=1 Tax=Gossypium schwendimanii TaxID=34291 RepID=A0A7J9L9B0_GOSSC|nr:hypothetical protein [Gossypium schwendimanii]